MKSPKQELLEADGRYMAMLIRESRERWRKLPQSEKDRYVRWLEDERQIAAEGNRGP